MEEEERKESNVGVGYKFVFGFIGVGVIGVSIAGLYLAYYRKMLILVSHTHHHRKTVRKRWKVLT